MQARIQRSWKHFVEWVIVISVIRWTRARDRIAQSNKRLERTRQLAAFIRSSMGEPLKRSVMRWELILFEPNCISIVLPHVEHFC